MAELCGEPMHVICFCALDVGHEGAHDCLRPGACVRCGAFPATASDLCARCDAEVVYEVGGRDGR